MIFEKKYDNSLWLMIKSNKKVANDITKFFYRFPHELLIRIRESIKKYDESNVEEMFFKDDSWYEKNLCGSCKGEDGLIYKYNIDVLGILEIGESFITEDNIVVNIECITLYPLDLKELNDMTSFYPFDLGSIGSGFTIIEDIMSVPTNLLTEVSFIKCPFGNIVNSSGYLTGFRHSIHRINVNNMLQYYYK